MPENPYEDPLRSAERKEFEEDLISFCDRELDFLGNVRGLDVLYAGGSSLLWLEGLSRRIGDSGSLTALDLDEERIQYAREQLPEADLAAPVSLILGDVFDPPFGLGAFDLVYSAGLFHELDVREEPAGEVLKKLSHTVRADGRIATSDFVDVVPAAQVEEERLQEALARAAFGREFFGIGPPERLVALHENFLSDVSWHVSPPCTVRHFEKLVLAEEEPAGLLLAGPEAQDELRRRRNDFLGRVRREGYTRPATLYVEGIVG